MDGNFVFQRKLRIEILDPDPSVLLKMLTDADIPLENVIFPGPVVVNVSIRNRDYNTILEITSRRGAKCKLVNRQGLLWNVTYLLRRPVLLLGTIFLVMMTLLLPGRILRVDVVGNNNVPAHYILQKAEESGLGFGSAAKKIRSESVKNRILSEIPELQWVGINIKGCVATIQVEERSISTEAKDSRGIASIVAVRDGVISDVIVHRGTALCVPGQSVLQGETLISGYSDLGLKITATTASGEVFGYTRRDLQVILPVATARKGEMTHKHTCYRLRIGKKVINFCNHSGISGATCDKMYSEYYWALPGGFRLPVSVMKLTWCDYKLQAVSDSEKIPSWLEADSEAYLLGQMVAGKILHSEKTVEATEYFYCLRGSYDCREMIGKVRSEEITEKHAENN